MTQGQARLPHESQKGYRARLKKEQRAIKGWLRGRRIWPASKGTYVRAEHGEIGSQGGK